MRVCVGGGRGYDNALVLERLRVAVMLPALCNSCCRSAEQRGGAFHASLKAKKKLQMYAC